MRLKGFLNQAKPGALSEGLPERQVEQASCLTTPSFETIVGEGNVQLHVSVPDLESMEHSDLHVAEKSLKLIVGHYSLKTDLPHAVEYLSPHTINMFSINISLIIV